MPRLRRYHLNVGRQKPVATTIKRVLGLLIAILILLAVVFIFKVGVEIWPGWLVEHRSQAIGILSLALFTLILASPVIVEVGSHPRPLSGPGRNPYQGQ